jgi:hypothetical protein
LGSFHVSFFLVLAGGERLVFFVDPLLRAAKVHGFKRNFMR